MYKISWVAKWSRPEASGSASILAQHLKAPTVSNVIIANRVVKFLRSSASQCLTIWRHDPRNLRVISVSDAGGIGGPPTENGEHVQNAHLIMVADQLNACGRNDRDVCGAGRRRVGTDHDSRYLGSDSDSARQDRRESSISGGSPQQLHSLQATASRPFDRCDVSFRCSDQRVRRKPSGSPHGCGPRNRQRNTQTSRLSHPLDPAPTHACRLDDEGRSVRQKRGTDTLATHWKAGLGRRDNSTERAPWQDQSSQSSTVGNQR